MEHSLDTRTVWKKYEGLFLFFIFFVLFSALNETPFPDYLKHAYFTKKIIVMLAAGTLFLGMALLIRDPSEDPKSRGFAALGAIAVLVAMFGKIIGLFFTVGRLIQFPTLGSMFGFISRWDFVILAVAFLSIFPSAVRARIPLIVALALICLI